MHNNGQPDARRLYRGMRLAPEELSQIFAEGLASSAIDRYSEEQFHQHVEQKMGRGIETVRDALGAESMTDTCYLIPFTDYLRDALHYADIPEVAGGESLQITVNKVPYILEIWAPEGRLLSGYCAVEERPLVDVAQKFDFFRGGLSNHSEFRSTRPGIPSKIIRGAYDVSAYVNGDPWQLKADMHYGKVPFIENQNFESLGE